MSVLWQPNRHGDYSCQWSPQLANVLRPLFVWVLPGLLPRALLDAKPEGCDPLVPRVQAPSLPLQTRVTPALEINLLTLLHVCPAPGHAMASSDSSHQGGGVWPTGAWSTADAQATLAGYGKGPVPEMPSADLSLLSTRRPVFRPHPPAPRLSAGPAGGLALGTECNPSGHLPEPPSPGRRCPTGVPPGPPLPPTPAACSLSPVPQRAPSPSWGQGGCSGHHLFLPQTPALSLLPCRDLQWPCSSLPCPPHHWGLRLVWARVSHLSLDCADTCPDPATLRPRLIFYFGFWYQGLNPRALNHRARHHLFFFFLRVIIFQL
ncbi:lITAF domain-containing protein isoform X1 [Marmota marmota marmota]|uniref:lITAF domain-containing protein isoform X1 n=1 Tax=Marmota marmota marmota TaxID=9994 RepID=UPI0020937526|nr:lITAF domain-containing protein isoform X1 [Marmota marmota marmota]